MDKKELEMALAELKTALEKANEQKIKAAQEKSEKDLKAAQEAIQKMEDEKKELETKLEKLNETIVTKDELQRQMDALTAQLKKQKMGDQRFDTFGDAVTKAIDEHKEAFIKLAHKEIDKISFDVKNVTTGTLTMTGTPINPGISTQIFPGVIVPQIHPHARNFMPNGAVDGAGIYYISETSWSPNAAYQGAEGATKGYVNPALNTQYASAVTIAALLKVSRQAIEDVKFLQSYINMQAPEKLLLFEDGQVLYGDGLTNDLQGLFTAATSITPNSGDNNNYDRILTGMKQLSQANYIDPDAIWINSGTLFDLLKMEGTTGYYLFNNFVLNGGPVTVAGKPIIALPAINSLDFLVGNFALAAQLLFREGINVRIFEQNSNDVETNMLTIRIEERVALPIYRPYALAKGSFVATT